MGGFGIGRWVTQEEIAFISRQRASQRTSKKRPTKLYPKEADISLAARSFHSVVLSFDAKPGPIRDAYNQGGKVIFLTDFDRSETLGAFIKASLMQLHLSENPN